MRIRLATVHDRSRWFDLWRAYAEEQYQLGSVVKPTPPTWRQYLDIFNSYVEGSLFGTVLLAEVEDKHGVHLLGTAMGGENPAGLNFETTRGKSAIIWGVYVIPEYRRQGISKALLTRSKEIGIELGFESAVSEILPHEHLRKNALAMGTEPYTTAIWMSLKGT